MIIVFKFNEQSTYVGHHNFRVVEKKRDAKLIERITKKHTLLAVYKTWNLFRKFRGYYNILTFDAMMNLSK